MEKSATAPTFEELEGQAQEEGRDIVDVAMESLRDDDSIYRFIGLVAVSNGATLHEKIEANNALKAMVDKTDHPDEVKANWKRLIGLSAAELTGYTVETPL